MSGKTLLDEYFADLNAVFLREDCSVQAVKTFQARWRKRGVELPTVSDEALAVSIRKVQYNSPDCPEDLRRKAKRWLLERGFSTSI